MVGQSTGCFGSIIIKCEDIETKGVKQIDINVFIIHNSKYQIKINIYKWILGTAILILWLFNWK